MRHSTHDSPNDARSRGVQHDLTGRQLVNLELLLVKIFFRHVGMS
jgi:hypothetical protein